MHHRKEDMVIETKIKRKWTKWLTLFVYCHIRPFAHTEPFPLKTKTKGKVFFFLKCGPFHTHGLCSQTCSGQKRNKEFKIKRTGGVQRASGVKFKFVIPHVQVNIKMLQVVQLSCQQDRFRARQAKSPCTLLNKKGLGYWQDSLFRGDEMLSLHSLYYFFSSVSPPLVICSCKGRATVSLHQEPKLNLPLSPLSYGRRNTVPCSYDFDLGWHSHFAFFPICVDVRAYLSLAVSL